MMNSPYNTPSFPGMMGTGTTGFGPGAFPGTATGNQAYLPSPFPGTAAGQVPAIPFNPSGSTSFPGGAVQQPGSTLPQIPGQLPIEESYIENILRLNLGKVATIYMTFENNSEWNAKVFRGRLEAAGRDHIIISDPTTGMRYLLLMVNLDYVTFDEPLNYYYPFQGGAAPIPPGGAGGR